MTVVFCFHLISPNQALADSQGAVTSVDEQVTSLTRIGTYPLPSQELRYFLNDDLEAPSPDDGVIRHQQPQEPRTPFDLTSMHLAGHAEDIDLDAKAQQEASSDSEQNLSESGLALSKTLLQKVSLFSEATQMLSYSGVNTVVAMFDSLTSNYYQAMDVGPVEAHVRFLRNSPQGMEAKLWTMKNSKNPFQSELVLEFNY
jgi:hypothetical protein